VAGDLGGLRLAPGLYKSTSYLEISSGNLTLDAKDTQSAAIGDTPLSFIRPCPGKLPFLASNRGKAIKIKYH